MSTSPTDVVDQTQRPRMPVRIMKMAPTASALAGTVHQPVNFFPPKEKLLRT